MSGGFLKRYLDRLLPRAPNPPPVIRTQWGDVTESARHQAALNMRDDPLLFARVHEMLTKEMGGDEQAGWREFRKRYPEAFG